MLFLTLSTNASLRGIPTQYHHFGIGLEPHMINHNVDLDIIAQNSAMDNLSSRVSL